MPSEDPDNIYMRDALDEARKAFDEGEVPIGAVLVYRNEIIARAHNRCELLDDPTAHAEMLVIKQACRILGNYRLNEADVFVTIEPCVMCAGALHLARVRRVVFGCADIKGGAMGSQYSIHLDERLNHRLIVKRGLLDEDCRRLMQSFFQKLRSPGRGI